MKCVLISIGDELLIGQVVNSNASYLGQLLLSIGLEVVEVVTIGDNSEQIREATTRALERADIAITTGGLGPTKDDITVSAIAKLFDSPLEFSEEAYEHLSAVIRQFGREPTAAHRDQCYLPRDARLMKNNAGTAPGLHFERSGKHVFVLPGVPHEMKYLMEHGVLPTLTDAYEELHERTYRTFATVGEGESRIAEVLAPVERSLPDFVKIAYLPATGRVRIRVFADIENNGDRSAFEEICNEIETLLAPHLFATEDIPLAEAIGNSLRSEELMLSVAESCTGGFVGHLVTSVPGSSDYFAGGAITYSNTLKMSILGVKEQTLKDHGAVSEATAIEMAEGAVNAFGSDLAVSITGVAGPDGGTEEKPVGTVWIACSDGRATKAKRFQLTKDRARNIELSGVAALNMVRKFLMQRP